MNDRLVTLGGALLALIVLSLLLYSPAQAPSAPRPTSQERGPDGYYALKTWLATAGIKVLSLQERYSTLGEKAPERGNVLIVTAPFLDYAGGDGLAGEAADLTDWLDRGNMLILLSALNETPKWAAFGRAGLPGQIRVLTGMSFTPIVDEDDQAYEVGPEILTLSSQPLEPTPITLLPEAGHPLFRGVDSLQGVTDMSTHLWAPAEQSDRNYVMQLAPYADYPGSGLWQFRQGEGMVLISGFASLFANRGINRAGNARFLENVLAYHLAPDGVVIFDDYHQGISSLYDPDAFFSDPRLHISITFVILFWLLYLLGTSARFGRPRPGREIPRQSELVQALAGFMTRKLRPVDAGRLLIENWLDAHNRGGTVLLTDDETGRKNYAGAWPQLRGKPLLDSAQVDALQQSYEQQVGGTKVDLRDICRQLQALDTRLH